MSNSPQASTCNSFVTSLCFRQCTGFGNKRNNLPPRAWFLYFLLCICTVSWTQWHGNKNRRMHCDDSKPSGLHLHFNLKHLGDTCIQLQYAKKLNKPQLDSEKTDYKRRVSTSAGIHTAMPRQFDHVMCLCHKVFWKQNYGATLYMSVIIIL